MSATKSNLILNVIAAAAVLGSSACSVESTTPATETTTAATATTNSGSSSTSSSTSTSTSSTTTTSAGPLALAFPGTLNLGSAMVSASGAGLRLSDVEDVEDYQTVAEKQARVDAILEAETVAQCFQLAIRQFTQPTCFAPNLSRSTYDQSPSSYVVSLASGVNSLLYGDGGILTESEGDTGEACTAATINYFMESAVSVIDQGREIFASLVCAARFSDTSLPAVGETKDYIAEGILDAVTLPDGLTFNVATMSREALDGGDAYTTELSVNIPGDNVGDPHEVLHAIFKHQPDLDRGHAIAFHAGVQDGLQSANGDNQQQGDQQNQQQQNQQQQGNLLLTEGDNQQQQQQNQQQQGGQQNQQQQGSGSNNVNVVAVRYSTGTDGSMSVSLDKATFKQIDQHHPADYITSEGVLNLAAIGIADSGNNTADNIVRAVFNQGATGLGSGIVGWTASLSDSFWRSFAYDVSASESGGQIAKSTFGYAKSWVQNEQVVYDPTAPKGMFCSWAQGGGSQQGDSGDYLEPAGPSGNGYNAVQYQVSTRTDASSVFSPSSSDSQLGYTVGEDNCGSSNTLAAITEAGAITGVFDAPSPSAPSVLGGVSIDADTADLSTD